MESTTQITAWMGFTTTVAAGCELRFAGMLQESSTGGAKLKKQSRTAYGPKSISLRTFPPAKSTLQLIRLILSSDTIEYLPGTRSSCRPWSWRGCVGPGWILITQDLAFDSKRIRVLRSAGFTEPPISSVRSELAVRQIRQARNAGRNFSGTLGGVCHCGTMKSPTRLSSFATGSSLDASANFSAFFVSPARRYA